MADAHLEREDDEHAYAFAIRQVELDPGREGAHRQVMRALSLGGQGAEALAYYERAQQMLLDSLGVEPAPETVALADEIKRAERGEAAPPAEEGAAAMEEAPPSEEFSEEQSELKLEGWIAPPPEPEPQGAGWFGQALEATTPLSTADIGTLASLGVDPNDGIGALRLLAAIVRVLNRGQQIDTLEVALEVRRGIRSVL